MCVSEYIYLYTHMYTHKLPQFSSFSVVSDIQFFDIDIEDMSICKGIFSLSVEYYTDSVSILDFVIIWYVHVSFFPLIYTLFKIDINVHWGVFSCICSKEVSKSHKSERQASQTSQHP